MCKKQNIVQNTLTLKGEVSRLKDKNAMGITNFDDIHHFEF
jgi:hypothetical protein